MQQRRREFRSTLVSDALLGLARFIEDLKLEEEGY
jgi:hypothetical protein